MIIKDNFLDKTDLLKIKNLVEGSDFPWFYFPSMSYTDSKDGSWFGHLLCTPGVVSNFLDYFNVLFQKMDVTKLLNAKVCCMLFPNTSDYHVDKWSKEMNHKTAIFYLNTNNGYTEFETGEKVDSVENRLLIFNCNKIHRGKNQTNKERRLFLNINYYD
jgi:hypothetical protein